MGTAIVSRPKLKISHFLVSSRLSDGRAKEENSGRKEKQGETRGSPPPSPPRLPRVQFNSFPTDRRALLPKCLEKATVVATAFVN